MERIEKHQLLKMTSGYTYKVQGLIFCGVFGALLIMGKVNNLIWLMLVIGVIILIILTSLLIQYKKITRIMSNGKIITTRVVELERTSYSLKYEWKLRMGAVKVLTSYYDEDSGKHYLFKTYCDGVFFNKRNQFWEGDLLKIDCDSLDVYVNRDDYNDYVFLFKTDLL